MNRSVKWLLAAALLCNASLAITANAAVFAIQLTDDQRLFDYEATAGDTTTTSQGVGNDLRTGVTVVSSETNPTGRLASTILSFPLPSLSAGEEIISAFLTVHPAPQNAANVPLDFNADLYGLPIDPAADGVELTSARHFTGALDPGASPTGTTRLLQDNYLVPELTPDQPVTSVDVSDFIGSLYAGGAVGGDFAILRLSSDSTSTAELRRFRIRSAGGTTSGGDPVTRPLLTITTEVAAFLPTDFNESGTVDGDDLTIWRMSFGSDPGADADGDGDTDGDDFLAWQRDLNVAGGPAAGSATAIPEPSTIALASALALTMVLFTRRSHGIVAN